MYIYILYTCIYIYIYVQYIHISFQTTPLASRISSTGGLFQEFGWPSGTFGNKNQANVGSWTQIQPELKNRRTRVESQTYHLPERLELSGRSSGYSRIYTSSTKYDSADQMLKGMLKKTFQCFATTAET